ncbi:hypothetical protein [Microbispora hainanensis]|jgi:hypothetical protein|uniref:hypothetical protein n=1 Tax=Microbispora hainanensis TaxID=568844 RepID=UPI003244AB21
MRDPQAGGTGGQQRGHVGGDADVVAERSGARDARGASPEPLTPEPDDGGLEEMIGDASDIETPAEETPPPTGSESAMPEAEPDVGPTS